MCNYTSLCHSLDNRRLSCKLRKEVHFFIWTKKHLSYLNHNHPSISRCYVTVNTQRKHSAYRNHSVLSKIETLLSNLRHFVLSQQHKNTHHVQAIANYLFWEALWNRGQAHTPPIELKLQPFGCGRANKAAVLLRSTRKRWQQTWLSFPGENT